MPFSALQFVSAKTGADYNAATSLFLQYADSLEIDLGFQHLDEEMQAIATQYGPPHGALWLACCNGIPVGCAGIRRLDKHVAELKRMYVQPAFRHYKAGRGLLEHAVDTARALGYRSIRLDTLPTMKPALALYHSFGFKEIPPYCFNPVAGALFLEKEL